MDLYCKNSKKRNLNEQYISNYSGIYANFNIRVLLAREGMYY